jgi:hypothetical protein
MSILENIDDIPWIEPSSGVYARCIPGEHHQELFPRDLGR